MFEISARGRFSSAHHLRDYDGMCSTPHGHNWEVEVFLRGKVPDKDGILVDFRLVKQLLRDVLEQVDHKDLNTLPAFRRKNPTSEHIAAYLYGELSRRLGRVNCAVHRVTVHETPETCATYIGPEPERSARRGRRGARRK